MRHRTFEARDVVHKGVDFLYVITVAAAAIFIRPKAELLDGGSLGLDLGLSLCLTLNTLVLGLEKLEILLAHHRDSNRKLMGGWGSPAKRHCIQELLTEVGPRFLCYGAATAVATFDFSAASIDEDAPARYNTVFQLLMCSLVLGTLVPLCGYLMKLLPPDPIPWHYQHIAHRYGKPGVARRQGHNPECSLSFLECKLNVW